MNHVKSSNPGNWGAFMLVIVLYSFSFVVSFRFVFVFVFVRVFVSFRIVTRHREGGQVRGALGFDYF